MLEEHLKKNGLENTEFWLAELKKLKVTTIEALNCLKRDKNIFCQLENKAEQQVEKNALRKLLEIDELENEEEQKLEKRRKALKAEQEKASKIKTEVDKNAKSDESYVLKNLSPASWTSSSSVLEKLIQEHNSDLVASGAVQMRENFKDSMFLQNSCGGLALQGILLSKHLEDQLEERRQLLENPKDFTICRIAKSDVKTEHFSSIHELHEYEKKVSIVGTGVAVSGTAVYGGVTLGVSSATRNRNEDKKTSEKHKKKTFSSTAKHSEVQVARCSFQKKDLKLAADAKEDLKEISRLHQIKSNVYEACKRFFEKYGSHVNYGPLIFGGRFWWTCSSEGFSEDKRETVEEMQSFAISTSVGISFASVGVSVQMDYENIKGKFKGKNIKDTIARTKLEVKTTGGPPEATDVAKWMGGLVINNSTWELIDRGKKLMPIWEIIKIGHEEEFGHLREVLSSIWQKMTGLTVQQDLLDVSTPELTLKKVSEWSKDEQSTLRKIQDRIEHLLKAKRELLDKIVSPSFWISEYLEQLTFQEFLLSVKTSSHVDSHIKFIMKQLVEKEELDQMNTLNFPAIEEFSEWLYEPAQQPKPAHDLYEKIIDFTSFIDFLNKSQVVQPGVEISNEEITESIEKGILRLRVRYDTTYYEVLVTILLYPFRSFHVSERLKTLTFVDRQSMIKSFSEQTEKFKTHEGNALHLQCYLLLLAMDQYNLTEKTQFELLMRKIIQVMKGLQPPFEEKLAQEFERHIFRSSLITEFKQHLLSLMKSQSPKPSPVTRSVSNSHSLKIALQTPIHEPKAFPDSQMKDSPHILLEKFELSKYYPKKLSLQDALCVRQEPLELSRSGNRPKDPKQLPFLVLHKLMSYEADCRSELLDENKTDHPTSTTEVVDSDDDYIDSDEEGVEVQTSSEVNCVSLDKIHPMDCLLALFLCSDDFLLQDLFSRLAKCQLAVPFVITDPSSSQLILPLWALEHIVKDWKVMKENNVVVDKTYSIIDYPTPIVSFIRIGKNQRLGASKSKLLNDVISDSRHDFFFHRDCSGGQHNRILGEGLVDMCWYLPNGESTDIFPDAFTFLNLHGDARDHPGQCRLLSQISSMCFVLLTEESLTFDSQMMDSLKRFNSSPGGLRILNDVKQKPKVLKKRFTESTVIDLTDPSKTGAVVKGVIRKRIIKHRLTDLKDLKSIRDWCANDTSALVDEGKSYSEGLKCANQLKNIILKQNNEQVSIKEGMLPLQSLWKAWADKDKEQNRHNNIGKEDDNEYNAHIEIDKSIIRKEQLKYVQALTPVMASLIQSLFSLEGPSNRSDRNYFLQCLKLELNALSRKSLAVFQHQYQSKREELFNAVSDSEKLKKDLDENGKKELDETSKEKRIKLKKELEDLQNSIVESSCGLEHLLRELSQVYEAALVSKEYELYGNISRLPRAVAAQLIDGHPLELMDGDAAHVPLEWVTAVLQEAVNILGDPNIFVLSVLGLQSTGKSTMLNAAFGVQFNVSAGRCTRGAYMQLLPVDEEIKSRTKCSHILIVDTEGLRAPELDPEKTHKHDNELATFVIGLANITLINIYGDTPGDMDDILQTSVHAFLRMTKVNIHPSCQFVHQNVLEVNVKSKVGRARFTEKLNKFTRDAAREEKCEGQCETFSDVIKFNDHTDVHDFPALLIGNGPMAPVSSGYSKAAQSLKQRIIEILCDRASSDVLCLSSFQTRISDLWKTLLKEKFVFSFKNSLEIAAYNSLEAAYSKWKWTFQDIMTEWEHKAENEILPKPPPPIGEVSELVTQKLEDLEDLIPKLRDSRKIEMNEFFSGKHSEILVQWREKFEISLGILSSELMSHAEEFCHSLLSRRETISDFEEEKQKYTESIKRNVQQHIDNIKKEQEDLNKSLEKRKFTHEQLKKLLARNLFTSEQLTIYEEQGIIARKQKRRIISLIEASEDGLKEDTMNQILTTELAAEDVKTILRVKETEEELRAKFEEIWIKLTRKHVILSKSSVPVEKQTKKAVRDFARSKTFEGQFIDKLKKKRLIEWGAKLDLVPEEELHYKKVIGYIKNKVNKYWHGTDPCKDEAIKITHDVFREVDIHLQKITKKDSDFSPTFITDVLREVDQKITDLSTTSAVKKLFTFTPDYRVEMYLIACGYALPMFNNMAKLYEERNDPLIYLENHEKEPLFSKFKNQYHQTRAEEAITNTLCAYLGEPIKEQIKRSLCLKMVTKMRNSEKHFFSSKQALKVKVLIDLHDEGKFDSYEMYVRHVGECLRAYIKKYTIKYCDEEVSGEGTRLQITAKGEVTHLIGVVENIVTEVDEKKAGQWLSIFCKSKKLRSDLGVNLQPIDILSGIDPSQVLHLENFREKIRNGLLELKKILQESYGGITCKTSILFWKDKPHEHLSELVGCTEQCPYCGEQCDLLDNHEGKHRTEVHRPNCLGGTHDRETKVLSLDFCPVLVADPKQQFYKSHDSNELYYACNYEEKFPNWSIVPDKSAANSLYWKWFVAEHSDKIGKMFSLNPPPVPSLWSTYTPKDQWHVVEDNLKKIYKL